MQRTKLVLLVIGNVLSVNFIVVIMMKKEETCYMKNIQIMTIG